MSELLVQFLREIPIEAVKTALTFAILAATVYGFVAEKVTPDIVSLLSILALILTGVLAPSEAFAGISHPATISLAAVLVLSSAVERTGLLTVLARRILVPFGTTEWRLSILVMVVIASISAFLNNTAAVAIFIPVVVEACRRNQIAPGRILMPMSLAATFGGLCTLVGTSTNIVANEFARASGLAGFSMFEPGKVGLPLALAGFAYVLLIGRWFLPKQATQPDGIDVGGDYVAELIVGPNSQWLGKPVDPSALFRDRDINLVRLTRHKQIAKPLAGQQFKEGDSLHVIGPIEELLKLAAEPHVDLHRPNAPVVPGEQALSLAEVVVLTTSGLVGRTLKDSGFAERFDAIVLGIRRRAMVDDRPSEAPLQAGDVLLVEGGADALRRLTTTVGFVTIRTQSPPETLSRKTRLIALVTTIAVIVAITTGLLPTATAALSGCAVMVLTGCLRARDAYESIDLSLVLMLAGTLALGVALEKTGITLGLGKLLATGASVSGPFPLMIGFFLVSVITSEFLSNSGTVALLGPVAISVSIQMGTNPMAMVAAVCFGSSAAFAMPLGYQTNLMIFGPGGYRVRDFVRMGIPLDIIFAILACWLIPIFWPLHA